jgi:hypothetical protein
MFHLNILLKNFFISYFILKRLKSQSKNPCLFGVWTFACTGRTFFVGTIVGVGSVVGDRAIVTVGFGGLVGVLVGNFVGVALNTAFLCSRNS